MREWLAVRVAQIHFLDSFELGDVLVDDFIVGILVVVVVVVVVVVITTPRDFSFFIFLSALIPQRIFA